VGTSSPTDPAPTLPDPVAIERTGLVGTGILGAAWTLLPALLGFWLLARIGPISEWLASHPGEGIWIYVGLFALSAGFGLLPTYAQSILGGWVFGLAWGVPAALAGFAGGAVIGFLITRLVAKQSLETAIARHPRASVIREALIGHGFGRTVLVVALLRMPPNSPFALSNLVMAATGVRFVPFILGTVIGMTPRTALAVWLAHSAAATGAADIQGFLQAPGRGWILAVGVVSMLVVVAVIGAMAKAALARLSPGGRGHA